MSSAYHGSAGAPENVPSSQFRQRALIFICRWGVRIVGACLIFAGLIKCVTPAEFLNVMRFDGFSPFYARLALWVVALGEILLGHWLIFDRRFNGSMILAVTVLLVYSAQLGYLLLYPDSPACGCLGLATLMHEQWNTHLVGLFRNAVFIFFCIYSFLTRPRDAEQSAWRRLPTSSALLSASAPQ
ncbi:MAG TPA: MauE/DoxX family redox-associated membrane protein [Tepidisphaeraceae bacterium]|jgi:hypothetical protein